MTTQGTRSPFSPTGPVSQELQVFLDRINSTAVNLTYPANSPPLCADGFSRCLQPFPWGSRDEYGVTALGCESAASCQFINYQPGDPNYVTRYNGGCQANSVAAEFLVECKSSSNDFIYISYNGGEERSADNAAVSQFKAYGDAKALFTDVFTDWIDLYKQSQTADNANENIWNICPAALKSA